MSAVRVSHSCLATLPRIATPILFGVLPVLLQTKLAQNRVGTHINCCPQRRLATPTLTRTLTTNLVKH
jgi:hypothetical protein